jgi:hypothetical protein
LARLAHAMSIENKLIRADVVEAQEFPNMARMYNVSAVPKTIINNVVQIVGNVPEQHLLEKVMQVGYKEPEAEKKGS